MKYSPDSANDALKSNVVTLERRICSAEYGGNAEKMAAMYAMYPYNIYLEEIHVISIAFTEDCHGI